MQKTIAAVLFLSFLVPDISAVTAATTASTALSGGGSLRGEYSVRRQRGETIDDWNSSVNAFLGLFHTRQGEKGGLSLNYRTNYSYNFKSGTSSWSDHRLNLSARRELAKRLRFNLTDTYIWTNDLWGEGVSSTATGIPEPDDPIAGDGDDTAGEVTGESDLDFSEKIGREKFWSNLLSASLSYDYSQRGAVSLGYIHRIFKYVNLDLYNYEYNNPWVRFSYRFSAQWNGSLSYSYTDANFERSEDFITHHAGANLNYVHSVHNTYFVGLRYYEKEYDLLSTDIPSGRSDFYAVRANLGWTHNFSPHKTLSMTAGPAYLHYEDRDPHTSTYFDIYYTSDFKRGSWYMRAEGGFDDRSFQGRNEGVSEYQKASTGVGWVVAKDLSASLGASMRTDGFLENPLRSDEKTYTISANLLYRFSRWFYVSGRYWFVMVDDDINNDDSSQHRFFITLGASRELYRWIH